jgi:hypothetical protein
MVTFTSPPVTTGCAEAGIASIATISAVVASTANILFISLLLSQVVHYNFFRVVYPFR